MVLNFCGVTSLALAITLLYRRILHVNQTTVAMSFLVLILIVASRLRLAYSVYLSIICALLYNFFFLPPVGTLTIADPQNWIALTAFFCASFLVSHLSNSEHMQAELSEKRRQEVERLYIFSQELLLHDDPRTLARISPSIAATVFGFSSVALYVRDTDAIYSSDSQTKLLPDAEMKKVAYTSEAGLSNVDDVLIMPLMLGMRSMGSLAFRGGDDTSSRLEAIGSLVAIALERAAALERSSHMEAQRESERLRSALLDSITHDLRTPLTSIRVAATTLISQPQLPDVERWEMYTIVDEESERLDKLIGQAVEMAQLDSESIQVKPQPEDIRELIAMALEESRPLLGERPEQIDVPDGLPHVSIDRVLLRRVLRHLIENAAKYSPPGSPLRIHARIEGYRLLVSVEDQGHGIDATEQPFIFDKFFRGKNQKTGTSGTGMGLAIVKAIMAAHGGGIEVISQPGEGSTFTFWLPVVQE
jgi:two-component system, OmpR family, sensor histidine kinase KdpD